MEEGEYKLMFETEKDHWWFKGKRKIVFSQIGRYISGKENKILDIGCGTGIMMESLRKYGKVFGIDMERSALRFCQKRKLENLVEGTILALPFKKNSLDMVCLFDVLYHKAVKSDHEALKEIYRVLKPGGIVILTDAADIGISGRHDIATHVRERYSIKKLSKRLEDSGFIVKKMSYFNTFLYPIVYITRFIDNKINGERIAKSDIKKSNGIVNFLLYSNFVVESVIMRRKNLPFGVSIFAVAAKR